MSGFWWDLHNALHLLRRSPGFTLLAAGSLALGIGASTTMFTAIDGILLRPLPYQEPDRLLALGETGPAQPARGPVSAATYVEWKSRAGTLEKVAAFRPWGFVLTGGGAPERLLGARVSSGLFAMLGVEPIAGRSFAEDEEPAGGAAVALLSESLWRRRFAADPTIIGKAVLLDGVPVTVVGIMPAGFALPSADVWVPLRLAPYELDQRGNRSLTVIARIKPGVSLPVVRSELEALAGAAARRFPATGTGWHPVVVPLQRDLVGDTRPALILLFAATLALLVVATLNLGNLVLVRSFARLREISLRAALGASRVRLARQLLAENLVLVALAAAAGAGIAVLGTEAVGRLVPGSLRPSVPLVVNLTSLGFAAALGLFIGGILALIPILRLRRVELGLAIKSGADETGRRRWSLNEILVVGQVAVALILLVGGGLLIRSLEQVQSVRPGFDPSGLSVVTVSLPSSRYPGPEDRLGFYRELLERLRSRPEFERVAFASHFPLGGGPLLADYASPAAGGDAIDSARATLSVVTPGYVAAMGIPLIRGRDFTPADRTGSVPVALVDAVLAERTWPGQDPVGQRIRVGAGLGGDTALREVVGIVGPVRALGLERDPEPMIYLPHAQNPWPTLTLVVRSGESADRVGRDAATVVQSIDPDQPVYGVRSLEEVVDRALASRRFQTELLTGFALMSLLLALLGVYGTLSFQVARRTRELGIRAALGATREELLSSVMLLALRRLLAGCLAGGVLALLAGRLLQSMLYQVSPSDPVAFAGGALILLISGLAAGYLPARRAMRLDPMAVLRGEG